MIFFIGGHWQLLLTLLQGVVTLCIKHDYKVPQLHSTKTNIVLYAVGNWKKFAVGWQRDWENSIGKSGQKSEVGAESVSYY